MEKSPTQPEEKLDLALERQNLEALEEQVSILESEQKALSDAITNGDTLAQKKLTESVNNILIKAKKLQAVVEGRIENPEKLLTIDRSINIVTDFLIKSKTEGGLGIDWLDTKDPIAESDEQNALLDQIDLSKVRLDVSWLPKGQSYLGGEKRLEALKSKSSEQIRLDAYVFATLWKLFKTDKKEFEEKLTIIAEANSMTLDDLKKKAIFFDGTIIRDSGGSRSALCLSWSGGGWGWGYYWLDRAWDDYDPSLVLAI